MSGPVFIDEREPTSLRNDKCLDIYGITMGALETLVAIHVLWRLTGKPVFGADVRLFLGHVEGHRPGNHHCITLADKRYLHVAERRGVASAYIPGPRGLAIMSAYELTEAELLAIVRSPAPEKQGPDVHAASTRRDRRLRAVGDPR